MILRGKIKIRSQADGASDLAFAKEVEQLYVEDRDDAEVLRFNSPTLEIHLELWTEDGSEADA